jgi:hypothetical protein
VHGTVFEDAAVAAAADDDDDDGNELNEDSVL